MIAFGPELLAQQLAVPGRMLPVDKSAVETDHIFAQRIELRAFALLQLGFDPVHRLLHVKLQRRAVHAPHIGQHVDCAVDRDPADEFDQSERTSPANPDALDLHATAAPQHDRQRDPSFSPAASRAETMSERSTSPRCSAISSKPAERR